MDMDFEKAIQAHVSWKRKLSRYIASPDHSIQAAAVASDGNCGLGQWLKGEGKRFASLPEFAALNENHIRFHKAAGEIISKADQGLKMAEEVALGSKSEYGAASNAVVSALMKMKTKAA